MRWNRSAVKSDFGFAPTAPIAAAANSLLCDVAKVRKKCRYNWDFRDS